MFYVEEDRIYLTRGDDAALNVALRDASGSSYSMQAGDQLVLTVRRSPADEEVVFSVASGSTRLLISHEDTADAVAGEYSADIQLTSGGQRMTVRPAREGRNRRGEANVKSFVIRPEVTRT